jgi:hypothetical protein
MVSNVSQDENLQTTVIDAVEEGYVLVPRCASGLFTNMRNDMQILYMGYLLIKVCELVEVCGKKTKGMNLRRDIPFVVLQED